MVLIFSTSLMPWLLLLINFRLVNNRPARMYFYFTIKESRYFHVFGVGFFTCMLYLFIGRNICSCHVLLFYVVYRNNVGSKGSLKKDISACKFLLSQQKC